MSRLTNYVDVVWLRARADLSRDVSRTYLGVLWWVLEPVLYMAAFYLVFALGVRGGGQDGFVGFLLAALVPWKWFSSTVTQGSGTLVSSRGLMQQVYLPKWLLPLVPMVANTFKLGIILALLLVYVAVAERPPGWDWLALVPVLLATLALILGCCFLTAALVPFAGDLKLLINNGMLLLMFLSGIFYDVRDFDPAVRELFYLNPLVGLFEAMRATLLEPGWPDWGALAYAAGLGLVLAVAGGWLLVRYDRVYPKRVS